VLDCAVVFATINELSQKNVEPKPFYEVFTNLRPKHVVQCASGDAPTIVQPNNLHPKHAVQCASGDALNYGAA
jgi:hypothetical protein